MNKFQSPLDSLNFQDRMKVKLANRNRENGYIEIMQQKKQLWSEQETKAEQTARIDRREKQLRSFKRFKTFCQRKAQEREKEKRLKEHYKAHSNSKFIARRNEEYIRNHTLTATNIIDPTGRCAEIFPSEHSVLVTHKIGTGQNMPNKKEILKLVTRKL